MTEPTLDTRYDPARFERRWYQRWESSGAFNPDHGAGTEPFCIVIPPPNVTGKLHIGHALQFTLQDLVTRWRRMQGAKALWLPGTDHAGIATQVMVERQLVREGVSRQELGRERFLERMWQWKAEHKDNISEQAKALGSSCDWTRERFTLDEGLSNAVLHSFVTLYDQGLIYRDRRLINWCVRCHTALSDLEVVHQDRQGHLSDFAYPLEWGGEIVVSTTRPETMLGDSAIAVHPDDHRYRGWWGRSPCTLSWDGGSRSSPTPSWSTPSSEPVRSRSRRPTTPTTSPPGSDTTWSSSTSSTRMAGSTTRAAGSREWTGSRPGPR